MNAEHLTELQKEAIDNRTLLRKKKLRNFLEYCLIALICAAVVCVFVAIWKLLEYADAFYAQNFSGADKFFCTLIAFLLLLAALGTITLVLSYLILLGLRVYDKILEKLNKHRVYKLDFKIRGILNKEEYKEFLNMPCLSDLIKQPLKDIEKQYDILVKLADNGITIKDFEHCITVNRNKATFSLYNECRAYCNGSVCDCNEYIEILSNIVLVSREISKRSVKSE